MHFYPKSFHHSSSYTTFDLTSYPIGDLEVRCPMFNILSNSDASFATAARTDEQNRMPTDYLVNSSSNMRTESEMRYNSEGLVKGDTENNEYSNLASSINQSVGGNRVKTVIQPVIQNQITQVPTPVPIAQPVDGSVTRMKASQLPNNIAKLIQ